MSERSERSDRLARRYERLLEAYPESYRARRGAEILGTLLDGARPGQRWPSVREAVGLLRGGLLTRLAAASPSFRAFWYGAMHLAVVLVLIPKVYSLVLETQGDVRIVTIAGNLRLLHTGVVYLWLAVAALAIGAVLVRAYRVALVAAAVLAGLELVGLSLLATPTDAGVPASTSVVDLGLVLALLAVLVVMRPDRTLRPPRAWIGVVLAVALAAPASYVPSQYALAYRLDLVLVIGLAASLLLGLYDVRVPAAVGLYMLGSGAFTVALDAVTGAEPISEFVPYLVVSLGGIALLAGLLTQRLVVRL